MNIFFKSGSARRLILINSPIKGISRKMLCFARCHGLRVYPVCVCNTVRLGQVRSRHNLKPSGTRFECVYGLSV